MKKKYLSCAVSFVLSVGAEAAPVYWTGNTSDWSDSQNWDIGILPGENDEVYIDGPNGHFPIITDDISVSSIDNNYHLAVNDAKLVVANTLRVGIAEPDLGGESLTGRLSLLNATVDASEITVGGGSTEYTGFLNAVSSEINTKNLLIGYLYGNGHGTLSESSLSTEAILVGTNRGTGKLDIRNSEVSTTYLYIGYTMGQGVVNVDNSRVNIFGPGTIAIVGERAGGDGVLNITNGGIVTSFRLLSGVLGGHGEINVSGQNSSLSTNSLTLAQSGSAIMTVSDGGEINTTSEFLIADQQGSNGVLNIGNNSAPGYVNSRVIKFGNGAGMINFSHTSDDYKFLSQITGDGTVNIWSGSTTLQGGNDYTGNTNLHGGYLRAGSDNAFSAGSDFNIGKDGVLDLNGYAQTVGTVYHDGTIYMNEAASYAGTTLTVDGDYHGQGGTLVFNSQLAGDASITDSMHITGDTDGSSYVTVNNLGGQGAQTVEGIEIIRVDGNSDGQFVQRGRIVAGAYDYNLVQGGNGGNSNNWYLTSSTEPVDPIGPVDPTEPPSPPVFPNTSISRPEAGSYMTNLAAANEMFMTRLEDRSGDRMYTDPFTGEKKLTSMWIRTEGRHLDSRDSSGQLNTDENRYVIQMGGDIASGTYTGTDIWRTGLMAGYGSSHSTTDSSLTGYRSEGNVSGYSVGLYGTWFRNADQRTGAYIDTWLQYAWYDNEVQGKGLAKEKYDSDGLLASVEGGYTFHLWGDKHNDVFIQPQAQVVWSGVTMDEHRETNGTRVAGKGENNTQSRLGVKAFMEHRSGKESVWKPYLAANWLHNSEKSGVRMDDVTLYDEGRKDIGEAKLGVEASLIEKLSVQVGVSSRFGSDNYRDTGGGISVRYEF